MPVVLDNTVMSNFALVGRTDWLRKVWPGKLVTSGEAWAELQGGVRDEALQQMIALGYHSPVRSLSELR